MANNLTGDERARNVQAKLMQYFERAVGQTVYVKDLEAALRMDQQVISRGVNNLRRKQGWETVETVARGQAWRYPGPLRGPATTSKLCFEQLGETREGDLILQCEDGRLFRAREL